MEWRDTPKSSNIKSVGFENNILMVTFKTGGTYKYEGVSKDVFDAMLVAPSTGKYFLANVKNNYKCTRVK